MALKFDTPQETVITKNAFKVISFSIDVSGKKAYIVYAEGVLDEANAFTALDNRVKQEDITGAEFAAVVDRINTIVSGQSTPNVYAAIKRAFYEVLSSRKAVTGTVV